MTAGQIAAISLPVLNSQTTSGHSGRWPHKKDDAQSERAGNGNSSGRGD